MQTNRRAFVKASGAVAVLGASGLAGCMGLGDGGGSQTWQYDPAELAPSPNVVFGSVDYGTLWESRDELPQSMREDLETEDDSPISPGDLDHVSGVGGGHIGQQMQEISMFGSVAATGDLDREAMVEEIESEGEVTEAGEYEGYALFEAPDFEETGTDVGGVGGQSYDGSGTIALGDSAMIVGAGLSQGSDISVTGQQTVERAIDAAAGDAALLDDTGGASADLKAHVGDSMLTFGMVVDPDLIDHAMQLYGAGSAGGSDGGASQYVSGLTAGGFGADVDGEETTMTGVLLYESASRAEDTGIADLVGVVESEVEQEEGISDISASVDGAAVLVTVTGDTETLADQGQGSGTNLSVAPYSF